MLRILFTCLFLCFLNKGWAQQTTTFTAEEKATLDSMFNNDEFFKMLNEKADTSYVEFSVGVSNGVFSIKNNSLNADQATSNKIFYTPAVAYVHKSGFGISVTCYLASDSSRLKVFQYAFNPSYSYYSKKINISASYTRYITGSTTGFDVNPYKNDLYGNIVFKKPWFRPSIGVGYSSGRTKEYFDSVITFTQIPRTITIRDTITTKLSSFSMNLSISHIWDFKNVISRNDELEIQPMLSLNGSNQKLTVAHSGSLNHRRPVVQNLLKTAYGEGSSKEKFSLQSAAFSFGVAYAKGKFIIQPQIYLDYYLHDTESKKFTAIYSFVISYAF
ncbi:MAG: hypothetical protein ABI402_19150 [Ferruginibacter sp.]